MNRAQFLKLSTGIIGGLGIPGIFGVSARASETGKGMVLDDSYLIKGLTGMVKAKGWFDAHWGAGLLAGYYLCRDNQLDEQTTLSIKRQLDAVIQLRGEQFAALPKEPEDVALIEEIPDALRPVIQGGLRAHGHAVIFASLSIKALRDVPYMAQPSLIKGLCGLSRQIAKIAIEKQAGPEVGYSDTQSMIDATFDSLARIKGMLGHPSILRPNFTHMTTHTEALLNFETMGYHDLVKAGYVGHRIHIAAPVPDVNLAADGAEDHATLETIMSKSYWDDEKNQDRWRRKIDAKENQNGYWIAAGHLFKVLYSYHRLIGRVKDKEKVALCSKILLERYINPDVQGG